MVTIKDGCGCGTASCCSWKDKLEEAYKRATVSVNKIGDDSGNVYYPDGTGYVKLPLPTRAQVAQIQTNADDIATLKQRATASEGDIDTLEQDVVRIDAKDTAQDTSIKDNSDRITSTNNDLVATEATVATHDSDIITLKAQTVALGKSLVSDVLMTDGTTAGSVQVSIEREDGALITSANYKWGRDIGVRLEAGTQAGYIKTVISLSDGTELESNEYKIVEVLESDVYVTAITLVPDMTAGTIGGNISYSNGTTQTINAVNVPTAPGVTSAIEALQSRMTAVEQKNTSQDSQITSLNNRVQAIEDTPGVGQFAAGKLGTIAGSAVDGRIAAEDDGTGSVNGWSALKGRVTAAEGQIVAAQNDISALDGTVAQQTTDISGLMTDVTNIRNKDTQQDAVIAGKVTIDQGVANAGKALIVGEDGNLTPSLIKTAEPFITLIDAQQGSADGGYYYINPFQIGPYPIMTADSQISKIITMLQFNPSGGSTSVRYVFKITEANTTLILNRLIDHLNSLDLADGNYTLRLAGQKASTYLSSFFLYSTQSGTNHSFVTFDVTNGIVTLTDKPTMIYIPYNGSTSSTKLMITFCLLIKNS